MQKIIDNLDYPIKNVIDFCKEIGLSDLTALFECYSENIFTYHAPANKGFYEISIIDKGDITYHKEETIIDLLDSPSLSFVWIRFYRYVNGIPHCDKSFTFK